jgi:hypothetical protein
MLHHTATQPLTNRLTKQQRNYSDMMCLKCILMLCSDKTPTTELYAVSSCGQSHY